MATEGELELREILATMSADKLELMRRGRRALMFGDRRRDALLGERIETRSSARH